MQLVSAAEQARNTDRQIQLANNQKKKTELVLAEVEKNDGSQAMFRSLGRMFVLCDKTELASDLGADLSRIAQEQERHTAMKAMVDGKKDQLAKQLDALSPGTGQ